MLLNDAVKKLRSGHAAPATIVLHGTEGYIRTVGVQKLIEASGVALPEMNVSVFDGSPPIEDLRIALERYPFMSSVKIVVLKETDILATDGPVSYAKALENIRLDDNTLFIVTTSGKLDRRKSYVKKLLSTAMVIPCEPLKGDALSRFIASEAKRRKLLIGRSVSDALAHRTQGDLYAIVYELDKMTAVCTGQITMEDIQRYVPESDELNMFRIFDTFFSGQHDRGFREVMQLVAEDPTPMGFVTFLANTFRQMLVARACRDARFSDQRTIDCVCDETGAKEWTARRAFQNSAGFTAQKLRDNVRLLADVEFGVKQGKYTLQTDLYPIIERLFAKG